MRFRLLLLVSLLSTACGDLADPWVGTYSGYLICDGHSSARGDYWESSRQDVQLEHAPRPLELVSVATCPMRLRVDTMGTGTVLMSECSTVLPDGRAAHAVFLRGTATMPYKSLEVNYDATAQVGTETITTSCRFNGTELSRP